MQPFHLFTSVRVLTPKGTGESDSQGLRLHSALGRRKTNLGGSDTQQPGKGSSRKVFFPGCIRMQNFQGWPLNDHFPVGGDGQSMAFIDHYSHFDTQSTACWTQESGEKRKST